MFGYNIVNWTYPKSFVNDNQLKISWAISFSKGCGGL